ncbi:MAG: hypothetical protein ACREL1_03720 [bacterium]
MKRFFAALMTVAFLGTTAVVLADDATPVVTPVVTPVKKAKKHHRSYKKHAKKKKAAVVATPVADTTPVAQ